ncbi:hypothetical protein OIU83_20960 [Flavobacterium sp. LS1R49]|uniref:DUF8188 domain-containing protein n=1 Tax=Flavobacterium shii TaxID=2987687 RepID=A0A9X2ZHY8_9FLAO|nr:hypothetical protein [Flavobacterium shii]MCV9930142.1 hypothetical protein [Flavobacterium shii]
MSNYKNYIGWLLGSFVLFPLLLHFYSTYSINKNDGKKHYKSYINNSIEVKVKMPNSMGKSNRGAIDYKPGNYLSSYNRSGSNNGVMDKLIFYNAEYKKYFAITVFDFLMEYGQRKINIVETVINDKEIFITANQEDLTSPKYGTKENPVPVFNYKGVEKTIMVGVGNDGYLLLEPTQQEYKHNVITYLTYVMPKEEFEQRFGKQ